MDATYYQDECIKTAIYREKTVELATDRYAEQIINLSYVVLGLGEVGEIQNKFKKVIRDAKSIGEFTEEVIKELGDVLWYAAMLCNELDLDLSYVMEKNLEKLQDRQQRGVLQGSGDER